MWLQQHGHQSHVFVLKEMVYNPNNCATLLMFWGSTSPHGFMSCSAHDFKRLTMGRSSRHTKTYPSIQVAYLGRTVMFEAVQGVKSGAYRVTRTRQASHAMRRSLQPLRGAGSPARNVPVSPSSTVTVRVALTPHRSRTSATKQIHCFLLFCLNIPCVLSTCKTILHRSQSGCSWGWVVSIMNTVCPFSVVWGVSHT